MDLERRLLIVSVVFVENNYQRSESAWRLYRLAFLADHGDCLVPSLRNFQTQLSGCCSQSLAMSFLLFQAFIYFRRLYSFWHVTVLYWIKDEYCSYCAAIVCCDICVTCAFCPISQLSTITTVMTIDGHHWHQSADRSPGRKVPTTFLLPPSVL